VYILPTCLPTYVATYLRIYPPTCLRTHTCNYHNRKWILLLLFNYSKCVQF